MKIAINTLYSTINKLINLRIFNVKKHEINNMKKKHQPLDPAVLPR